MSQFNLTINMENAAFEDASGEEVGRILRDLAERKCHNRLLPGDAGTLRDINGNTVGIWKVTQ